METSKPRQRRRFWPLLCLILVVALGAWLLLPSGTDVILCVGADKRPGETVYRTDTILLAFCNWRAGEIQLLSIPRDTYVQLAGRERKTKINEAYAYGGLELLKDTISTTFDLSIDHYLEADFAGFAAVVEALGGVEIEVPYRMYKPSENINLEPGLQRLNGTDALAFVRYRDLPQGDIDRIANQQQFLSALGGQLKHLSFLQAPKLVIAAQEHLQGDIGPLKALRLALAALRSDPEQIKTYSLPGEGRTIQGVSYWVLYENKTQEMLTEITGREPQLQLIR